MRAKIVLLLLCVGFVVSVGFALVLSTRPGNAEAQILQIFCNSRAAMESHLAEKYQEFPTGSVGTINDQHVIVVYTSAGGETFSIVGLAADGEACLISSGTNWTHGANPEVGEPS